MWYWLLLGVLLIAIVALMPVWSYSRRWGWYRSGLAGVLAILWGLLGWFAVQPVPPPTAQGQGPGDDATPATMVERNNIDRPDGQPN